MNQGSTSVLCLSSWNLVHRSPFSSKAWMSLAASLMSLRSTCLCWVIPLTLRTLRARSLFTTGANSQSRSCKRHRVKRRKKQCRSTDRELSNAAAVNLNIHEFWMPLLKKTQFINWKKRFYEKIIRQTIVHWLSGMDWHTYANILKVPANFFYVYCTVKGHPTTSEKPAAIQSVLSRCCVVTHFTRITKKSQCNSYETISVIATCVLGEGRTGKRAETQGISCKAKKNNRNRCYKMCCSSCNTNSRVNSLK